MYYKKYCRPTVREALRDQFRDWCHLAAIEVQQLVAVAAQESVDIVAAATRIALEQDDGMRIGNDVFEAEERLVLMALDVHLDELRFSVERDNVI